MENWKTHWSTLCAHQTINPETILEQVGRKNNIMHHGIFNLWGMAVLQNEYTKGCFCKQIWGSDFGDCGATNDEHQRLAKTMEALPKGSPPGITWHWV